MKPNFALSLYSDSIRLLIRAVGGWRLVGEVSPTSDTLASELAALRKTASGLAPDGVRCKVVVPNEQIRYLSIQTPDMDMAQRRDAALSALTDVTPYQIDELAVDVCADGDMTHVAAVACETLAEAEAFVQEHRFHPVCFVAIPDENTFSGEPYFGPAKAARGLLGDRTVVEPDGVAIVVIGDMTTPDGPVAKTTSSMSFISTAARKSEKRGETTAGTASDGDRQNSLTEALDSLRMPTKVASAAPQNEMRGSGATFSSRRQRQNPSYDLAAPDRQQTSRYAGGFSEPEPASLAPPSRAARAPKPKTTFADEAARLTVFGARPQAPTRSAPRQSTIVLMIALFAVLIGLGAFASGKLPDSITGLFGQFGDANRHNTAIQVTPPFPQAGLNGAGTETAATNRTDAATPDPSLTDEDSAVLSALRAPLVQDEELTADDFRAKYAVTGIWPLAPSVPHPSPLVDLEDIYVTTIDIVEPSFNAVALPQLDPVNRDIVINTPTSPAPAGTSFALDERGLVVGTAQGSTSPDGLTIFSGAPPVRPQTVPLRPETQGETVINPDLAKLAAFRPRLRPQETVETTEPTTLGGVPRSALAQIRPPARPAPASTSGTSATGASLVPLSGDATPLLQPNAASAVNAPSGTPVVTVRPGIRPKDFDQIVARTQRAAASAAVASATAAAAASIAAPPAAAVKPKVPSRASVAQEATLRNAINLRKVNLIGVYGTPSQRRALVRLANGRYKKVQVGDRIDGGRISAIGEGELHYQKSGRDIVLKMPKG